MPTPKLYSRAMITIILLSILQVTLIFLLLSFIFSHFWVSESIQELFLYYINFIIPITLITAVLRSVKIGERIFIYKKNEAGEEDENLIFHISVNSCDYIVCAIIIYEIIYYLVFHIGHLIENLHILVFFIAVFGVFLTGLIVVYIFMPIVAILNAIFSYFTNPIFNTFFAGFYEKMPPNIDENNA